MRRYGWCGPTLTVLALCGATLTGAEPMPKQILLLQSFDRGALVIDRFTGDFRAMLGARFGQPVNIVQVVVGPTGFVSAPEQDVVEYVRSLYADRQPPDVIVSVAGAAATFAHRHRQELFPKSPMVYGSLDHRWLGGVALQDNETAVAVHVDFPRLVDDILTVLPDTRRAFLVTGAGPIGEFWHRTLEAEFKRFGDRLTFEWSDSLSFAEILTRVKNLPPQTAIVFVNFGSDGKGGSYADEEVLRELHAAANAPLFSPLSSILGHGGVGGSMISIEEVSRTAAEVTSAILHGTSPRSLRRPVQEASRPVFDWRELERWHIPESRLPPGSVVEFRQPTLWSEHRSALLTAFAIVLLQALLIARLLVERRARRKAEVSSRHNLSLAADASRRETMAALASSIGHELAQPLTAIAQDAAVLRKTTASDGAASETVEIVSDIGTATTLAIKILERHRALLRSRELNPVPTDLRTVVEDSLALFAHDLVARRVEAVVDLPPMPCMVAGDPVLLQQVLVNLIRNALEAMTETPPGARRLKVGVSLHGRVAEISIEDTGIGLTPEVLSRLFSPFASGKEGGLGIGLTVTRSILDAHGGTISAARNADRGATFTVTLPQRISR